MTVGGKLFGRFSVAAGNKVLYLVLEDRDVRVENRLRDFLHEFPNLPPEGHLIAHVAHGFAITDPLALSYLRGLVEQHGFNVVILDTYQRATPGISSFNDEEQSKILHTLANFTRETGVTLIVIDHVRKDDKARKRQTLTLDDIKGTGGKVQNADSVILMERAGANQDQIKLQVFSKDFDRRVGVLIQISPQGSKESKFKYLGELSDLGAKAKKKGEANREKLLAVLNPGQWFSSGDLVKLLGWNCSTVVRHLTDLFASGKVIESGKRQGKALLQIVAGRRWYRVQRCS